MPEQTEKDTFDELLDLRMKAQLEQRDRIDPIEAKVLTFRIDGQTYAVEIDRVDEIIELPAVTAVPAVPEYVMGVINVRSRVVPVMSVRKRFGKEEIPYTDRTCVLIITVAGMTVGLIADSVSDVVSIRRSCISATPDIQNVNADKFIKYIAEPESGRCLVLDAERLIGADDVTA